MALAVGDSNRNAGEAIAPCCSTHLRLCLNLLGMMGGERSDFTADTAPTGRNSTAQGETLGLV